MVVAYSLVKMDMTQVYRVCLCRLIMVMWDIRMVVACSSVKINTIQVITLNDIKIPIIKL